MLVKPLLPNLNLPSVALLLISIFLTMPVALNGQEQDSIKGLFLGDRGPHRPAERFAELQPELADRGIELIYTEKVDDLNAENLAQYDVLVVYANIDRIDPKPAQAMIDYVEQGGGFVPLHCASFCFRNVPEVVAMIGAQFQRHGTGVFRTQPAVDEHEIMQGFEGFESWDETYVHHLHNERNRTVLEYRVDNEGKEPWTWVRRQGEGRVFYTAWGHDARTWTHPGFQNLVERGIRWVAKQDPQQAGAYREDAEFKQPKMKPLPEDRPELEYIDVGGKIPNYRPSSQWGTQGENFSLMQKPLPPAESVKYQMVPEGFHVELFASEPDLKGKPIAMAWDERGRLWLCETVDYPNELQPAGKGRDRIRICEDADQDGKADKFTVFAEELSIPTSMAFYRGGVIVQDGQQTVYLKDTNGDDVADERKVLFTGWALGDTHGGVSNFHYGLDNWIWAMQGYNNSQPKSVSTGATQRFRQGFFRMKPDGSDIEFIRSTNNNTWGLGFSEEGIVFGSTANGCPSVYMPIANRYYEQVLGWTPRLTLQSMAASNEFKPITEKVRQVDFHGGFTAAAGHALYTARQYPQEYWNRVAFVNGPTGHLVATFVINGKGADYRSENQFNLFASEDEWTAPIMTEIGPDGQVWVIDWYNYIVQHNPTPAGFKTGKGAAYETDLRDKKYGRIYRVVADDTTDNSYPDLSKASPEELVQALRNPTMLVRTHAQRLLVERGESDVAEALMALVKDTSVDEIGLNVAAIHAIWTLSGLGLLNSDHPEVHQAVVGALKHPSAGVRLNAVKALPGSAEVMEQVVAAGLHRDADFQVRLATLLSFADCPKELPKVAEALVDVVQRRTDMADRWIADAVTSAAAKHSGEFLPRLSQSQQLSPRAMDLVKIVAEHHARSEKAGNSAVLLAALKSADPSAVGSVVSGLSQGWQANQSGKIEVDAELEKQMVPIFEKLDTEAQGQLIRLADRWDLEAFSKFAEEIADRYLDRARDSELNGEERVDAAQRLVEFRPESDKVVSDLVSLINPQTPPAVAEGIIKSLQASRAEKLGQILLEKISSVTPGVKRAIFATVLQRGSATSALLDSAEAGDVTLNDLALDQREFLAGHPNRTIRSRATALFEKGGTLPNKDREDVIKRYLPAIETKGDVARGQLVFKDQCSKCHIHGEMGNNIGPNLTGMAVHPKEELLTHILDPNRDVEANFRTYMVMTFDGSLTTGMLASESKTTLEFVDTEGKRQTMLREDIDQLVMSRKSVMPDGFESTISPEAMADLLTFLTKKGRYTPLPLDKIATVITTKSMFYGREGSEDTIVFDDWSTKEFNKIPFQLIDPQDGTRANAIILRGHRGDLSQRMPESVEIPCNVKAEKIHFLGGVGGWSFPFDRNETVSMIVRLTYEDGQTEDHQWVNGKHIADYFGYPDVPESESAFKLNGRQVRYLSVAPKRDAPLKTIELVRGRDATAPIVFAVTVESAQE